jgi:hypothetical protein
MRKSLAAHALLALAVLSSACSERSEPPARAASAEPEDAPAGSSSETAALCVEVYSPETLANRSFAFDGTVVSIETRTDPKLPAGQRETPWVTFDVHDWYLGGSGGEVGVWMDGLNVETSVGFIEAETGTRLLVAGEPRWGGDPLDDPLAWTCGFTQPWSEDAAAEWEAATA